MRFKSQTVDNYCIYAVAGTNTVSFAIDFTKAHTAGLLGFSIKRTYPENGEHYLSGLKVFQADSKAVKAGTPVSTEKEPIQSFVWDDFTLKPDQEYTYTFIPVKGKPGELDPQSPISIKVKTEQAFSDKVHDIFFNRGVASSQAYAREFNNTRPDDLVGKKQQDAFAWLTRDLKPALLRFIGQAKKDETLEGCFYEFQYPEVLDAFKQAINRGVHVTLIIDAKDIPKGPRKKNMDAVKEAKIPEANIIQREANKSLIQHNKFIVYLKGSQKKPSEVWTGSCNITESGIYGQTNVGHWVRDSKLAALYKQYWDLLKTDPGAKDSDSAADKKEEKAAYIEAVMKIQQDIIGDIPKGVTPIFSPRDGLTMLEKYFSLVDKAKKSSAITLAFGITANLKNLLAKHTVDGPITFMMVEKKDVPNKRSKAAFFALNAKNNVYEAFGSYIKDPLYEWVKETNMKTMGIAGFVAYIHSKFLIQNPLGNDPIIVTGSANFSPPSTIGNDENMIIIRGDLRVADIYFTEFNRIFNHYYFRAVLTELKNKQLNDNKKSYYLDDTDGWIKNYRQGSLRSKRVQMYIQMQNAVILE
jgi:phosphatidylserine/phosphatidylglycerophosphate/cardiolipin synthase-like enzyme